MERANSGADRETPSRRTSERDDRRDRSRSAGRREPVGALHAALGNQAVEELHERGALQPKLTVSQPADPAEREAERVADEVLETPEPDASDDSAVESGPDGSTTRSDPSVQRSVSSDSDGDQMTDDCEATVRSELCPRCIRRFRAGEPLGCQDCEESLQRTSAESAVRSAVGDGALQPKLAVGSPDDAYEREAERVAEEVLRMPDPGAERDTDAAPAGGASTDERRETGGDITGDESAESEAHPDRRPDSRRTGPVAGTSTGCTTCGTVRRTSVSVRRDSSPTPRTSGSVGGAMERRIQSARTGGRQLPESVRSFFEPRFGADLSDVRVHTGPTAAETADAIQAKAYTVGRDIVFNRGEYRPGSASGRRLLAHELTHVLQQRDGGEAVSRQLGVEHYPDCTPEITGVENPEEHLEDARTDAIDLVDLAVASLQRAANGNAGSRVQNALATHFQNPNRRQIQTAISQYRSAKTRLELPQRMICNTENSAYCRGNTQGYAWRNTGPYIHLCPAAVQDEDETALTMIHEATHVAGGTRDHSYVWEDSYSNMSAAEAVDNADSYAFFADGVKIEIIYIN